MKVFTAFVIVLGACGLPKKSSLLSEKAGSFTYELDDETVRIEHEAKSLGPGQSIKLQVRVNDKTFDIVLNPDSGLQNFDGRGSTLSHAEKIALSQAAEDLAKIKSIDQASPLEQKASFAALDYLSQAPDHYQFPSRSYPQKKLLNEGTRCIKKGLKVRAEWNTQTHAYVAEDLLVGTQLSNEYTCMGRCGADCGWNAPSAWTKDCLDYDACSYRNHASDSTSDVNCADEFDEAADDWLGGLWTVCSGK